MTDFPTVNVLYPDELFIVPVPEIKPAYKGVAIVALLIVSVIAVLVYGACGPLKVAPLLKVIGDQNVAPLSCTVITFAVFQNFELE